MHEMSIAESIVEIVRDTLKEEEDSQVQKVFVKIGNLVAVVPDSLEFCFTAITDGTSLAGSKLVIDTVPIGARCKSCGHEFEVLSFVFRCPECRGVELDTITGTELTVTQIEGQ
jgi:hydrogenase nickel incorporation protein HypA/HybF